MVKGSPLSHVATMALLLVWASKRCVSQEMVQKVPRPSLRRTQFEESILPGGTETNNSSAAEESGVPTTLLPSSLRPTSKAPTTTSPSQAPTSKAPTSAPPSPLPTARPTSATPSRNPTSSPSPWPSPAPTTKMPSPAPTSKRPTSAPTTRPTSAPTTVPTVIPRQAPTFTPTKRPSPAPTVAPITDRPTRIPTRRPSQAPSFEPTVQPSEGPTIRPTAINNGMNTPAPTSRAPSVAPVSPEPSTASAAPVTPEPSTRAPTIRVTTVPPTGSPTNATTPQPTSRASVAPTASPTNATAPEPTSVIQQPSFSPTFNVTNVNRSSTFTPTTGSVLSESPSGAPTVVVTSESPTLGISTEAATTAFASLSPTEESTTSVSSEFDTLSEEVTLLISNVQQLEGTQEEEEEILFQFSLWSSDNSENENELLLAKELEVLNSLESIFCDPSPNEPFEDGCLLKTDVIMFHETRQGTSVGNVDTNVLFPSVSNVTNVSVDYHGDIILSWTRWQISWRIVRLSDVFLENIIHSAASSSSATSSGNGIAELTALEVYRRAANSIKVNLIRHMDASIGDGTFDELLNRFNNGEPAVVSSIVGEEEETFGPLLPAVAQEASTASTQNELDKEDANGQTLVLIGGLVGSISIGVLIAYCVFHYRGQHLSEEVLESKVATSKVSTAPRHVTTTTRIGSPQTREDELVDALDGTRTGKEVSLAGLDETSTAQEGSNSDNVLFVMETDDGFQIDDIDGMDIGAFSEQSPLEARSNNAGRSSRAASSRAGESLFEESIVMSSIISQLTGDDDGWSLDSIESR